MSMNLVAIAGVPAQYPTDMQPGAWGGMSGKLVGTGGCGCALGQTAPTAQQKAAFNWVAAGLFGLAAYLAYRLASEPGRAR